MPGYRDLHPGPFKRLGKAFGLGWKRPPAHTSIRAIVSGLDAAGVETAFRAHAAGLDVTLPAPLPAPAPAPAPAPERCRVLAIDGKVLRGSFDAFHDGTAKQILSAFAADTSLTIAHIEIDEKSNEIPAAQQLVSELDLSDRIVTLDALHCQKNLRDRRCG